MEFTSFLYTLILNHTGAVAVFHPLPKNLRPAKIPAPSGN